MSVLAIIASVLTLTTFNVLEIMWINKVQYLGVYLVSSKALSCNYDLIKKYFIVHLM